MPSGNNSNICPICQDTEIRSVRCSNTTCGFMVMTCPKCDREQAVVAFVTDHEKDCPHGSPVLLVARPMFSAPRRAA